MEANVFTLQVGTALTERIDGYLGGEYREFNASMGAWGFEEVWADPDAVDTDTFLRGGSEEKIDTDWSSVPGFSNVKLEAYDLTFGLRYRAPSGWGWSGEYTVSRYGDEDPILEDESGTWSRFTLLVGKSF